MSAASVLSCDGLRRCRGAGVIRTQDGESICGSCHRRRETRAQRPRRKTVRQVVVVPSRKRPNQQVRTEASALAGPGAVRDDSPRSPRPVVTTVPCTTCDRGKISQARWDGGKRQCTRCDPLRLAAVGVHKSIPAIMLAEDVTPENVAQGRRRP